MTTVTLYHGTTNSGAEGIKGTGMIHGPAYFTPRREIAEDYILNNADEGVVIEVRVNVADLQIDMESFDAEVACIHEAIRMGASVYTEDDCPAAGATFHQISLDD